MLSYRWQGKAAWAQQAGPWLLGVDCAHLNFEDPIFVEGEHRPGWYARGNAGMAVVVPYWKVRELLELPELKEKRDREEARFILVEEARRRLVDASPAATPDSAGDSANDTSEQALRTAGEPIVDPSKEGASEESPE